MATKRKPRPLTRQQFRAVLARQTANLKPLAAVMAVLNELRLVLDERERTARVAK